jgi:hypothetical protein
MTKERQQEFLNIFIKVKYINKIVILDNAGSHNNELIKNTIITPTKKKNENYFIFLFRRCNCKTSAKIFVRVQVN